MSDNYNGVTVIEPVKISFFKKCSNIFRSMPFSDKILFFVLIYCLIALILYISLGFNLGINSDRTTSIILAKEIIRSGELFPTEFNFAPDVTSILYSPLALILCFTDDLAFARSLYVIIMMVIELICTIYVSKVFFKNSSWIISCIIFFSGISLEFIDVVFNQGYAASWIFTFIVLYLFISGVDKEFKIKSKIKFLLMCCVLVVAITMGARMLQSIAVPLLGSIVICFISDNFNNNLNKLKINLKNPLLLLMLVGISVIIGYILFKLICSICAVSTSEIFNLTDELGSNIDLFLNILSNLIGVKSGVKLLSADGILMLITAFCSVVFFFVLPILQIKNYKNENFAVRFYTLFSVLHVLEILIIALFSGLRVARDMFTSIILLIPLGANYLYKNFISKEKMKLKGLISILLIVLFVAPITVNTLSLLHNYNDKMDSRRAITNHLKDLELDFGYATYWNANVNTYLSNGDVEINAVNIYSDKIYPYYWLNSKQRYTEEAHSGKSFLLLTEEENNVFVNSDGYQILGEPILIDTFNGYHIYVYDYNISYDDFSGKGFQRHILRSMVDSEAQRNLDGTLTINKNQFVYGPYISLKKGVYNICVNVDNVGSPLYYHLSKNAGEIIQTGTLVDGENHIQLSLDSDIAQFEVVIRNDYEDSVTINDMYVEKLIF